MTQIRPRPTQHVQLLGVELVYTSHDLRPIRATRHCPICGARLARDRAFYDTLCSPCELRHTQNLEPELLHPERPPTASKTACPKCGGVKERRASQCLPCRRAGGGSVGAAGLGTEPAAPHGAST